MNHWIFWLLAAVLSLLGGVFALFNPFVASIAATQLAGIAFIASGLLTLLSALGDKTAAARIVALVLGLATSLLGLILLFNPALGMVSLTLLIGITLLMAALVRLLMAFKLRGQLRWLFAASGALSLVLGVMILGNFPESAATLLGIFMGIELVSNGASLLMLALERKKARA